MGPETRLAGLVNLLARLGPPAVFEEMPTVRVQTVRKEDRQTKRQRKRERAARRRNRR